MVDASRGAGVETSALDATCGGPEAARVPVSVRRCGRLPREVSSATVRRRARRMLRALSLADAELSVLLCDDPMMRTLNRRYRRRDRTTDVLAFALGEGHAMKAACPVPLGDVVISLPTAARQARA